MLLMTAATGAWADETLLLTIESRDYKTFKSGSKTFDDKVTVTFSNSVQNDGDNWGWYANSSASLLTVAGINGYTITSCKFYVEIDGDAKTGYTIKGESPSVYLNNLNVYTDNSQSVKIGKNGVTKIEVYEAAAPAGYTVSMKDGVKDADKWTISPNPAEEGQTVTLQYTGRLKVKGVTATSEAAPAEATPALSITSPSVGQVIGSDGKNYAYGSLPTGVTAVAKICYVSGSNGLALALADEEGTMAWSTAKTVCDAHTPAFTGGTWKLATKDEWSNMITAAGSYTALRDGFSSVGGTNMQRMSDSNYWSSTEYASKYAWFYEFLNGSSSAMLKNFDFYVRACLAFTVEQSAKTPATVTTAPTGAAVVGVGKTTALVSGGVAEGGTLWYAVTTTNTKPTSTAGFSDAVPTAQTITASGTVYVWYYVKADDTHSDSEIAATAIEVPVADIVWDATNVRSLRVMGTFESYEREGVTLSGNAEDVQARWRDKGNPTKDGIEFIAMESGGFTFTAPTGKKFTKIEMTVNDSAGWDWTNLGTGWAINNKTVTWTGSAAASTVDLLKDANNFNGERVKSIVFYLSE